MKNLPKNFEAYLKENHYYNIQLNLENIKIIRKMKTIILIQIIKIFRKQNIIINIEPCKQDENKTRL